MCPMLPDPNFLVSEVELPKEKHIKNSEPLFSLFGVKSIFLFSANWVKTEKSFVMGTRPKVILRKKKFTPKMAE